MTLLALFSFSYVLAKTYDTSWDGQGYHQTAVIGLAEGWNPMRQTSINLFQRLPSQIFAEGYPSALWEIEATIYAVTGEINSAKVVNIVIGIIAFCMMYILLRKVSLSKPLAFFTSFFIVIQPIYILQLLTFMQDGFGYELVLIGCAALAIIAIFNKAYWAIWIFVMTELLLVSTKYNHLPIALALGVIFLLIVINRLFNQEYKFNKKIKLYAVIVLFSSILLASIPYARNVIVYGYPFYPTNIPSLMGSVTYNNVPKNIEKNDKLNLLFYGIFSRSQSVESGDPRSDRNIAELKVPFTFSASEIVDSVSQYNNRVGAGGPLYSGIFLLSFIFLVIMSFRTKSQKERYAIYTSYFGLVAILALSLTTPAPNLMRYVSQLQLLPLVITIPLYVVSRQAIVKVTTVAIVSLIGMNTLLYTTAVAQHTIEVTRQINQQFTSMKTSGKTYYVKSQQFYSEYVLLNEKDISFYAVNELTCKKPIELVASATTTQYCTK